MVQKTFERLAQAMVQAEAETVLSKGEEYTHGDKDRLASFKETAKFAGMTPKQVCMVYMTKHFQSLANYVATGTTKSNESIDGRVMDLRVYLLLMMALIAEERADALGSELEFQKRPV